MLISLLEVCQEGGVKKGGTWRTLRVPERRDEGHGCSWCHEWCFFTPRKIAWKFCVDIFIGSASGRGGQEGGTWRTLMVPDRRLGGHGWSWRHEGCFFTPRKIAWKFRVDISIGSVSGRGYLEDFGVFLTGDMGDMVVPDIMNDVFLPQRRYPENFVLISLLEVCQEGGVKKGVLGGLLEASWRKTSRMGSSLRSWMTLGESKDHILKVSWSYLYFWQRYKNLLFLWKKCDGQTHGRTPDTEPGSRIDIWRGYIYVQFSSLNTLYVTPAILRDILASCIWW